MNNSMAPPGLTASSTGPKFGMPAHDRTPAWARPILAAAPFCFNARQALQGLKKRPWIGPDELIEHIVKVAADCHEAEYGVPPPDPRSWLRDLEPPARRRRP